MFALILAGLCTFTSKVGAQQHPLKPASLTKEQEIKFPVIPVISGNTSKVKDISTSSTPPKLFDEKALHDELLTTEPKSTQLAPPKPVAGLLISPPPKNMDRPKESTIPKNMNNQ